MEQKYQIGTSSGSLLWNIEKIKKNITKYPLKEYRVQELYSENTLHVDKEYAMRTDLSIPLIVVELWKGKEKLIDGNHRLYKAMKLGEQCILAYFLTKESHLQYIENYDENLYERIVKEF